MPGMAGIKGIKDVESWLIADWLSANTDGVTPKIGLETEFTQSMKNTTDCCIVNYVTELSGPFGIRQGAGDWRHDVPLSIEVRTRRQFPPATYIDHLEKLVDESARIIKARLLQAEYAMNFVTGAHNLSKDPNGAYILILDVTLTKINP